MDLSKIHCLTVKYSGITNVIACSVQVSFPESLLLPGETAQVDNCIAIWDTGASGSAITELQAAKLGLLPTGVKRVSGLGGTIEKNTYMVDIVLPNSVKIPNLPVTELDNPVDEQGNKKEDYGMLIGMDIISMGDFTITNQLGKTIMSFRTPSMVDTDYVAEWKRRKAIEVRYKRK